MLGVGLMSEVTRAGGPSCGVSQGPDEARFRRPHLLSSFHKKGGFVGQSAEILEIHSSPTAIRPCPPVVLPLVTGALDTGAIGLATGRLPVATRALSSRSNRQEKRGPELRRASLLPVRSLVKCIPDRPMLAGVIVIASRGIRRHQELARA